MAKDLFSQQADVYSKFRPDYPPELFQYILSFVNNRETAWDCATGNGQAAKVLAEYFQLVEASDMSSGQLDKAIQKPNIHYTICTAEHTPYHDSSFDLITVATAYHWLDHEAFRKEAIRVGKNGSLLAVWAYNLVKFEDDAVNKVIHHLYYDIVYSYWDPGRRHVEDAYQNVPFNYELLPTKDFYIQLNWTFEQLWGYLQTWSSVQTYINKNGTSPLELIRDQMKSVWQNDEVKSLRFPLFLKLGRIVK